MTDIIRLLPDNIANQIAAGEVVQRPASVVKELMENSVDAGAQNIRLLVKNGGKTLLQVIDDGSGMSETDARMCFERHATSKIRELNDLYSIHTLGFRGEAMASIAAVAQVELKTKRRVEETGTHICIEGSELLKHEACACPDGTSIAVKNLFFNVPARRNFLKSNPVEMRHIIDEFLRVALSYPDISFSLVNEGEELYHLRSGTLKQRIVSIFGRKYEEGLVPVEEQTDILTIKGYIGKPDLARKTRGEQFFFANTRFIKSGYLNHAVANAYASLLPADSHPFYCIFLSLSPSRIDINVHPTKTEIKFEDEKLIYAMLRSAIMRSLSQYHIAPSLNFEEEISMGGPTDTSGWPMLRTSHFPDLGPNINTAPTSGDRPARREMPEWTGGGGSAIQRKAGPKEWEELYKVLSEKAEQTAAVQPQPEASAETADEEELPDCLLKPALQMQGRYIVTTIRSGLMIIQQQLAHERILFERYLGALEEARAYSQQLLFPEVIQLTPADYTLLKEVLPEVYSLGFDLEEFGKNAFVLNGVPTELQASDPKVLLERIIEEMKNTEGAEKLDKRENLARALAKNASIKVGRILAPEEMARLIDELFACRMPYFSPDGKPVLITLAADELDKKFKKTTS